MIIKSLIQDDSKLTFDCAKATLSKGSIIDISDSYWKEIEIQNAIKMGLVVLVGPEPILPGEALGMAPEQEIRFRNVYESKLCFECLKSYVDPGKIISIPISKIDITEIRNAISCGWLANVETENEPPRTLTAPVLLEELTSKDILTIPQVIPTEAISTEIKPPEVKPEELQKLAENINNSPLAANLENVMDSIPAPSKHKKAPTQAKVPEIPVVRPKTKKNAFKAKPIASKATEGDEGENDLLKPSEVVMAKPKNKKVVPPVPVLVEGNTEEDEEIDFDKLFANTNKKD